MPTRFPLPTSPSPSTARSLRHLLLLTFYLLLPAHLLRAQTSGTYSTLTVSGTGSIGAFTFAPWATSTGTTGVVFDYEGTSTGTFSTILNRPTSEWDWYRADSTGTQALPAMSLSNSNQLILTGTQTSGTHTILIDPTSGTITINGQPLIPSTSSGLTVLSNGNVGIANTSPSASLTVGTGAWVSSAGAASYLGGNLLLGDTLTAPSADNTFESLDIAGIHQAISGGNYSAYIRIRSRPGTGGVAFEAYADESVGATGIQAYDRTTLQAFPLRQVANGYVWYSGTGAYSLVSAESIDSFGNATFYNNTTTSGTVAIGTTAPEATLHVQGSGYVTGALYLAPQGDIAMGTFQTPASDTPASLTDGGSGDDDEAMIGGGHTFGFSAPGTTGTSGTSGD